MFGIAGLSYRGYPFAELPTQLFSAEDSAELSNSMVVTERCRITFRRIQPSRPIRLFGGPDQHTFHGAVSGDQQATPRRQLLRTYPAEHFDRRRVVVHE